MMVQEGDSTSDRESGAGQSFGAALPSDRWEWRTARCSTGITLPAQRTEMIVSCSSSAASPLSLPLSS